MRSISKLHDTCPQVGRRQDLSSPTATASVCTRIIAYDVAARQRKGMAKNKGWASSTPRPARASLREDGRTVSKTCRPASRARWRSGSMPTCRVRPRLREVKAPISRRPACARGSPVAVSRRAARVFTVPGQQGQTSQPRRDAASPSAIPTWSPDGKSVATSPTRRASTSCTSSARQPRERKEVPRLGKSPSF